MTYGMNKILIGFSNTAAAVFGVYFKLQSFVFMPVFGLNNGLIPIVAYNYGARKKKRITGAIKYAMIYSVSIMIVGTIIMQIFPAQLLKLFDASDNMLSIGVTALRIISTHFFFAGFDIIIISSLQALGRDFPLCSFHLQDSLLCFFLWRIFFPLQASLMLFGGRSR